MPFTFVIRDNVKQTADDFAAGDSRYFDQPTVVVGTSADCDCVVDNAPEMAARHFAVTLGDQPDAYIFRPLEPAGLFLNNQAVGEQAMPITSGDEIRVGHLTFRFQAIHRAVPQARRADFLAFFAKILIAAILLAELLVVYWLPQRFQSEKLLAAQIQRQETVMLLDAQRLQARKIAGEASSELARDAGKLIYAELNTLAEFVREHEQQLWPEQWQRFYAELTQMQIILNRLGRGNAFPPAPQVDVDAAVRALVSSRKGQQTDGR